MDIAVHLRGRERRELRPVELQLLLDKAECAKLPVFELDMRCSAVRQHRPILDDLLAAGQPVSVLLAVLVAASKDIERQTRGSFRAEDSNRHYMASKIARR